MKLSWSVIGSKPSTKKRGLNAGKGTEPVSRTGLPLTERPANSGSVQR